MDTDGGFARFMQVKRLLERVGGGPFLGQTFIGGKEKNKHASKRLHAGRGTVGKIVVQGIVQRHGKILAAVVPDTSAAALLPNIEARVLPSRGDPGGAGDLDAFEGRRRVRPNGD